MSNDFDLEDDDGENLVNKLVEQDEKPKAKRGRPKKNGEQPTVNTVIDENEDVFVDEDKVVIQCSKPGDQNWTEYVLSKLRKGEFDDKGYPTTNGVRRLTEELIGPIVGNSVDVVQSPNEHNGNRAVVIYTIHIQPNRSEDENGNVQIQSYSASADSCPENTDEPFSKFPTSVAESRAKGRARREAMRLTNIVVSEELSEKATIDDVIDMSGAITQSQINSINILSKRLDIDVIKFINADPKKQYQSIEQVSKELARKMLITLNKWQRDKSLIPNKFKGYDDNWRD